MQKAIPQQRPSKTLLILLAALLLYMLSRVVNLHVLPVFVDEVIHIKRALALQTGVPDPGSIGNGKILSETIFALVLFLPGDSLILTRLVSVIAGALVLFVIVKIGQRQFGTAPALVSGFIYVLLPFALFYNRMALTDAIQSAIGSLIILVSLRLVVDPTWLRICILAFLLIIAFLAKMTGGLYLMVPILAMVLADRETWKDSARGVSIAVVIGAVALLVAIWLGFGQIQIDDKIYTAGSSAERFTLVIENIQSAIEYYWYLLTPPVAVLLLLSIVWGMAQKDRRYLFLTLLVGAMVMPFIVSARIWFPRYILLTLVPISLLIGDFTLRILSTLAERFMFISRNDWLRACVFALLALWPLVASWQIISRPETVQLPELMTWQFINGWPSGYGKPEAVTYLGEISDMSAERIRVIRAPWQKYDGIDLYMAGFNKMSGSEWNGADLGELSQMSNKADPGVRTYIIIDATRFEDKQFRDEFLLANNMAAQRWRQSKPGIDSGVEVWELLPSLAD